jgi:DUF1680 family protein
MGSRHRDEAFGDPYELPPDRAYAETCAAIASVMLAWRLLLATGDEACADSIERAMFNGVLSGSSLTGTRFFYMNPLQRRTHRAAEPPGHGSRAPWFPCACCPPNLMRLLSSWQQYLATSNDTGIQLHQYATIELETQIAGDAVRLAVHTVYPWSGQVTVRVLRTSEHPWTLSLRVPGWCRSATLSTLVAGSRTVRPVPANENRVVERRRWQPGDTVVLDLDLPIRIIEPHPRIDAVRSCVALERGPLVYCIETADLPPRTELEDLVWDPSRSPVVVPRPEIADSLLGLTIPVRRLEPAGSDPRDATETDLTAGAIPYFAWANRRVEGMRVWIPRRPEPQGLAGAAVDSRTISTGLKTSSFGR